jgi:hypothetical protein
MAEERMSREKSPLEKLLAGESSEPKPMMSKEVASKRPDAKKAAKKRKPAAKRMSKKEEAFEKGVIGSGQETEGSFAAKFGERAYQGKAMPEEDPNAPLKSEESTGMSKTFKQALSAFGPLLIGTLIEDSSAGAVAAFEGAQKADRLFRDQERADRELDIRQQGVEQQQAITPFQQRSLELRKKQLDLEERAEGRRDKGLGLQFQKFGLSQAEAGQLNQKQVESFQAFENTLKAGDRITSMLDKFDTGPLSGRFQSFAELADVAPEEFTAAKAETENMVAQYIQSISGAQASEAEVQRLKRVAPTITDAPGVFRNKLKTFLTIARESQDSLANAIKTGQPLKAGTIDNLLNKYSKERKAKEKTAPAGKAAAPKNDRSELDRLRKKYGR